MGPCAHTLSGGQERVLLKEPKPRVLGWVNRDRESGRSNLKSLAMGWWEKWGFILARKLSLDSCCDLLTVPRACSVCLSVSLLVVWLSLALLCPMAPWSKRVEMDLGQRS